jgi:hypothetical protein
VRLPVQARVWWSLVPVGAVAGGLIAGFFGRPFWGPPMARRMLDG